ncbi:MAG: carboxypeptidase M32 [Anaerolineaceae bacterium]|nr:carboxypeptidase M32 [Anaerolineaceae bacterium]
MLKELDLLKSLLAEVSDLNRTSAVLGWDQQTYMPPGGSEDRGHQLSLLAKLAHEKFVSKKIGDLLDSLQEYGKQLDPDSNDACLIRQTRHDYLKATRVPTEWVAEFSQLTSVAQDVWVKSRPKSDFNAFRPHLEKIVEMRRQYSDFFKPFDHVYDPQLDDFEPGLKTADVQAIFNELRPQQVDLLKQINAKPQVDDSFLKVKYDEQKQWDFGVEVITAFGYDWQRGRQDRSAHPFTTSFGSGDTRITTRFDQLGIASALFGTMHECGHALYDQGISHELNRTPLHDGASMAVHESQSRMWENLVGRSQPFWDHFYGRLQKAFPAELGNVPLDKFYKGINKVEPSLIRTEADEATYNLHIMLRLELEIMMLEGSLAVKDLPEAWNKRMEEYIGITPPGDKDGCMQDIHWSFGGFGYFPTYALGNLVSLQLWECIQRDIPELDKQIAGGRFSELLAWLRENVHQHGHKFEPQALIQKITGSKIDPNPYIRYLKRKFGEIYGL